MSDNTIRVRYGKTDVTRVIHTTKSTPSRTIAERVPKNTLTTIRYRNMVYFGIARCNSKLDRFNKNTGKLIASNRAKLALQEGEIYNVENLELHKSGLRGSVDLNNIKSLLEYFKTIDVTMQPKCLYKV